MSIRRRETCFDKQCSASGLTEADEANLYSLQLGFSRRFFGQKKVEGLKRVYWIAELFWPKYSGGQTEKLSMSILEQRCHHHSSGTLRVEAIKVVSIPSGSRALASIREKVVVGVVRMPNPPHHMALLAVVPSSSHPPVIGGPVHTSMTVKCHRLGDTGRGASQATASVALTYYSCTIASGSSFAG